MLTTQIEIDLPYQQNRSFNQQCIAYIPVYVSAGLQVAFAVWTDSFRVSTDT